MPCKMEALRGNENITAAYHRHEQRRNERYQVSETIGVVMDLRFMPVEPHGARPEREDRQRLVGPCEIAPYHVEIHKNHSEDAEEKRQCNQQSLARRLLVHTQVVRYDESRGTEGCVSAGNRRGYDTYDRQYTTYYAQPGTTHFIYDERCDILSRVLRRKGLQAVNAIQTLFRISEESTCGCCPDER